MFANAPDRKSWIFAVYALLGLCLVPGLASAADIVFKEGAWEGRVYNNSDTGKFARCLIEAEYQDGTIVSLGFDRDYTFEIWLEHRDWNLGEGDAYPVTVQIDKYPAQRVMSQVVNKTLVVMTFDNVDEMERWARFGTSLYIYAEGRDMQFLLDDTVNALPKARACRDQRMKAEAGPSPSKNPFLNRPARGASGDTGTQGADDDYTTVMDDAALRTFIAELMDSHFLRAYRMYSKEEADRKMDTISIAWDGPDIFGYAFKVEGVTRSKLVSELLKIYGGECEGRFVSANESVRVTSTLRIARLTMGCMNEKPLHVHALLYPLSDEAFYVISNLSGDRDQVTQTSAAFYDALKARFYGL